LVIAGLQYLHAKTCYFPRGKVPVVIQGDKPPALLLFFIFVRFARPAFSC